MTANRRLLQDWLRGAAGFDGIVVSDYHALAELIAHGVAADAVEAAALALRAGIDIDMMSEVYREGLAPALARGLVGIEAVDAAVRRVLALKERLGLFERPYGPDAPSEPEALEARRAARRLAREAAARSIVLLTNRGNTLPLPQTAQRIAVVGPLADARADMLGCWSGAGEARDAVSFFEGLAAARPDCDWRLAPGIGIRDGDDSRVEAALGVAAAADLVILCLGEASDMSGEAASRSDLALPGLQQDFANRVLALGRPVVAVLSGGRPLAVQGLAEGAEALLATWFLGHEAGNALADVLTGSFGPSARLPVTWPRSVGQVPLHYAERPSGRPASPEHYTSKYIDGPVTPLFPFGHGLTYGRFELTGLRADPPVAHSGETVAVTTELANTGAHVGEETLFLFTRRPVSAVARPRLELKAFGRLTLQPGARGQLTMLLPVETLQALGEDLRPALEPGAVELLVGPSADPERLVSFWIEVRAGRRA